MKRSGIVGTRKAGMTAYYGHGAPNMIRPLRSVRTSESSSLGSR